MSQKLAEVGKNPALNALLLAFMQTTHCDKNWSFFWDKGNNEALYLKFIKTGSPKEINIDSKLRKQFEEHALKKDFVGMTDLVKKAKEVIEDQVDLDTMPKFEASQMYKSFVARKAAEKKLTDQLSKVKKALTVLGIQEALVPGLIPIIAEYNSYPRGTKERAAALIKMNKAARTSLQLTQADNMMIGLKTSGLI